MKIGVSSYSFSQALERGELDYVSVVTKAAQMGFDGIEFTDLPGDSKQEQIELAKKIKAEADKCGIEITAYACGGKLYCDDQAEQVQKIKNDIDVATVLGAPVYRHDVLYRIPMGKSFNDVLESVAPAIREIAEYAESKAIVSTIENHGVTFQDHDRIEDTMKAVAHKNFGLLMDLGNFMCADVDNVFCVSRLASVTKHVHLKDMVKIDYYSDASKEGCFGTRAGNFLKPVAVGEGDAKIAQCIKILKKFGYDGYLDIEYEGKEDCFTGIQKGLDFFKNCAEV